MDDAPGATCYWSADRTSHCIPRGEHVVFMGDSITRYQWVALATSLHRAYELSAAEYPSQVVEKEWRHWMQFFNGSNARLAPHGRCDCHRSYARPVGSKTIENRFYWRPGGALNLTYVPVLDPSTIRGHWAPFAPHDDEAHRAAYHPQWGYRWSMNWTEAIEKFVRPLQPPPTVLLLNMGQWGALPGEGYARSLLAAAQRAAPRVLWKTTTRMRKGGPTKWLRTDSLARRVFPEIYDAAFHTRGADPATDYWDPRHFRPRVYNDLNAALLRQLYGPPRRCVDFVHGACNAEEAAPPPAGGDAPAADDAWAGVATRPPARWNALQTSLWVDALGITYNAAQLAQAETNGSALVRMAEQPGGLAQIGVKRPADVARLRARLRSAGATLSAQRRRRLRALDKAPADDHRDDLPLAEPHASLAALPSFAVPVFSVNTNRRSPALADFNDTALAWGARFVPLGLGSAWHGYQWLAGLYADAAARLPRRQIAVMVDSEDAFVQASEAHLLSAFQRVWAGRPLVLGLETGCPPHRCTTPPPRAGENTSASGIANLSHINGGMVIGEAWALEKLWRAVGQANYSCCNAKGQPSAQRGIGRFVTEHPELFAFDRSQRLVSVITNLYLPKRSYRKHESEHVEQQHYELTRLRQPRVLGGGAPGAPPRVVRYRLRNVHSRIAPCLVHMPGVKVGERNMKGRQVMVAPFDYVRAALVPTAESAEEVEARLDAAKRKAKGRFR